MANPARNKQLLKVMATLEKMMGRGRKHTTAMMKLECLRAVQDAVDLSDVDEVRTAHRSVG